MTSIYGKGYVADIDTSQERVDLTQENEQMPPPQSLTIICKVVNDTPALQSLLYDLNLLPEQTAEDARRWFYTDTTANHFIAYADAVRAEERERCAKIADGCIGCDHLADAIRKGE